MLSTYFPGTIGRLVGSLIVVAAIVLTVQAIVVRGQVATVDGTGVGSVPAEIVFGNFDCQFEANTQGLLQSTNIYLRSNSQITLASDDQKGARTWVSLPMVFQHGSGTTPKSDLPTPNGTFKVIMKVRLAGNKIGLIWVSKRNVVRLEVHQDSATGPVVASANIDRSVSSPSDSTMTTNVFSPNQPVNTFRTYYIMMQFDKYDGNGSNDGRCGLEVKVRSI